MQAVIESKLNQGLSLQHLVVENESHKHAGPATDSHFKLTVVSDDFAGKRPVARHQLIYGLLADEMAGPIHALALHLYTAEEWQGQGGQVPASPNCSGGH
ncbi:MAG: BolA family transcriptional regulator [Motiliproteus sp.]|nr:BolA family transcriptional regulator [Motiliproteus sp.]MCW9053886.1 BolA family transcriptional regulator [Motiliproteus sp.]